MDLREIEAKFTIENLKKYRTLTILIGIFLIGFSIRYITRHELLFDPDSYWWYRLAMYFSGVNTEYFVQENGQLIDQLAHHPTGRLIARELLILPLTIGYSFKLLGTFGITQTPENLLKYMFAFGPVVGGLTSVAAFFLVRELTNTRVAGLASLFYAVSIAAMTRSTAGDTGQESLGDLFIFIWLFLFIIAIKEQTFGKRQVSFALLSGLYFAFANNTWGGNIFYFGLATSSVLLYLTYSVFMNTDIKKYEGVLASYAIFMTSGLLLSSFIGPLRYPLLSTGFPQLLAYLTIFACLSVIAASRYRQNPKITFLSALGAVFLIALISGKLPLFIEYGKGFLEKFTIGEKDLTGSTVAYYRKSSLQDFKNVFGILLASIPLGLTYFSYNFYKNRDFRYLFLILWVLLGIIAFQWMIRLSVYLALIIPIFTFALLDACLRYNERTGEGVKKLKKSKKASNARAESTRANVRFTKFMITGLLLFLVVLTSNHSLAFVSASKFNDGSVVPWKDVGTWLKENTPEDALLIHWWDYGYHLQTFAERRTIVDGGNSGKALTDFGHRNIDVAKAFTSPEDEFYSYIKPYNPEDRPIYVLVSYAEFGKSGAINFHVKDQLFITSFTVPKTGNQGQDQKTISEILARNQISTYYVINYGGHYLVWALVQFDNQGQYHPEWSEKLLAKLLPFNTGYGQGLKHFEPVYQNGYVYVYKFVE
ncbi:MAG: STT3 domain-containing protein [Thermodesulfobacteriota bacterium]